MRVDLRGDPLVVPPGLQLSPIIDAVLRVDDDDVGGLGGDRANVIIRLEYSADEGRYVVGAFGVDRAESSIEVTGALLRRARVQAIAKALIGGTLPPWASPLLELRHDAVLSERDWGDYGSSVRAVDVELTVGLAYRVAQISNENPAQAVAETFGMRQRTATNWIRRAREAGHLTEMRDPARMRQALGGVVGAMRGFTGEELERYFAARPWTSGAADGDD